MSVHRPTKPLQLLSLILLSFFLIIGCSSESSSSPEEQKDNKDNGPEQTEGNTSPQPGGTITIGSLQEPDTLDVHKTAMSIASNVTSHIGGTLVTINPDTKEVEPYLAESFDVSEDGKTITFKIRQGVTFTDGTPLTAQHFKDTFDRILSPDTGATVAASMVAGIQAISVPDDQTFVVELAAPSAPFLRNLASDGYMQPILKSAVDASGDEYGRNPVGAGAFTFKEWVTGQSITLQRNDAFNWPQSFYENQGKAYPDQIVYKFIPDAQTMLAALDSGSIDIAVNVAPNDVKRYRNNDQYYVLEQEIQGLGLFMEMNTEDEVLSDVNVRKAINMGINKDAIVQAVLSGEGTPAYGPIAATIFGYDPNVESYGHKLNKDEAIKLLEASGYSKNSNGIMEKDGKPLKFDLTIMSNHNQAAQMVQAMLKEIGVEISIQSMEAGTLIEKVSQGDYEMSFLSYSYTDPDILYLLFHSSQIGGLNHSRVKNSELDALLEKGRVTIDAEDRKQVYGDVQKIIVDEAYWAPIYTNKLFYVVSKRVSDVKLSNTSIILHDAWVKQ